MNHELLRKLFDSGFPFEPWQNVGRREADIELALTQRPRLSELIAACGDGIAGIEKHEDKWFAVKNPYRGGFQAFGGKTIEEAVTKLYLALHE